MADDVGAAGKSPKQEATNEAVRPRDPAPADRRKRLDAILNPFAPATAISAVVIINSLAPAVAADFQPPREVFIGNNWPRPNVTAPWNGERPDAAIISNSSTSPSSGMVYVIGPSVPDAILDAEHDASPAVDVGVPRPILVLARKIPSRRGRQLARSARPARRGR